ncbi:MAG: YccF domain-containing protein [Barnesiella sp.]|nr:YccF domain-containing protein [Barnesiella sp.]MBD5345152.1 YccF domain-containing protein [Bacteroides sp.]
MNTLLNIIWMIFGGLLFAIEYVLASLTLMITIIGIPFGLQTLKLAQVALWPFGTDIDYSGGFPSGCFADIMNVIWWFVGGFAIALTHLLWGVILCITIIGIPFGKQNFKLMRLALFPFGKSIS